MCRKVYSSHNTPFHGCSTSSSAHHCRRRIIRLSDVLNHYSVLKELKNFRVRVFRYFSFYFFATFSASVPRTLYVWMCDVSMNVCEFCERSCETIPTKQTRFSIRFVVAKWLYERNTSSRQGVRKTAHEHRNKLRTRVFFTFIIFHVSLAVLCVYVICRTHTRICGECAW